MGCSQSQVAARIVSPEEVVGKEGEVPSSRPVSSVKEVNSQDSSSEPRRTLSDAHPPAEQIQDNLIPQQTGDLNPGSSGSNVVPSDTFTCQRESPFDIALLCKSPIEVHSDRRNIDRPDRGIELNTAGQEQYAPTSTYSGDHELATSSPFNPYQEYCSEIECLGVNLNNSTSFSLPRSVGLWSPDLLSPEANANQSNARLATFFKCLQDKSVERATAVVTSPDSVKMYPSCSPSLPTKQSQLSTLMEE